jgi:hypothetical protein
MEERYELRFGAAIAGLADAESHPISPKPLIEVPVDVSPQSKCGSEPEYERRD